MLTISEIKDYLLELDVSGLNYKHYLTPTTGLVFTSTLLASYLVIRNYRNQYSVVPRWPPGPKPWPIIGNASYMAESGGKTPNEKLQELSKEFGPIIHMYFGMGMDMVFLTGTEVIRDAYINNADVFSNRPNHLRVIKDNNIVDGLIMSNGDVWKLLRRFVLRTLKDFGVGKTSMELCIQEEAKQVVNILLKEEGKSVDPKFTINNGVSNIICMLIFGQRYDHDDVKFRNMLKYLDTLFNGSQNILQIFLPLWFLKYFSKSIRKSMDAYTQMKIFVHEHINNHRLDFDVNNLRDFTDYYIKGETDSNETKIEDDAMFSTIIDLFTAGTETTTTTLRWMILYMLHNPRVQVKCREEIHRVIGKSRMPTWKDRAELPYTSAMIMEVQRYANIVPLGAAHCTSRPIEFMGYLIPEKTLIFANITDSMFNENDYPKPLEFSPERWLNEERTAIRSDVPLSYMPFGQRICAGEQLAKMELFIFTVTFLQQVRFDLEDENVIPTIVGVQHSMYSPKPYNVRISSCL